jgi:hypothetical protein
VSSTSPDRPEATTDATPEETRGAAPEETPEETSEATSEVAPSPAPETSEDHLLIDPARVRRAPRYPAFLTVGAIVGIVGGLWLGRFLVSSVDPSGTGSALLKPGVFVTVTVLAATTFTMLLAGLIAVLLDRRSVRRSQGR